MKRNIHIKRNNKAELEMINDELKLSSFPGTTKKKIENLQPYANFRQKQKGIRKQE